MYLGPILDGKCLNSYPPKVTYFSEEIIKRNETAKGVRRYHNIGFQFQFTLDWSRSMVTETMWEILRVIVNKKSQLLFTPFPDKYPNSSFYIYVIGGMSNLTVENYIGQGYRGTITLETINPVTSIPAWAV